ncbi:GNAT family N-acetyltransferase [Actinoplanes sp. HUAS TT8]|uniref:GNAT family N-acetyltransferase n=1 Tax=Actinoplanes sp. HUAS TT8 TaxID=3447453 RepID=UPI003F5256B7
MVERQTTNGIDADVVMLHTAEHLNAAAELLWNVWGARDGSERNEVISGVLLRTLSHGRNYVAGVFDSQGEIIGCTVGIFASSSDDGPPDYLQSYIAGVDATKSNHGVGYAMKRHQRLWALARGLPTIVWTFDPLVSRNAYFNLCKLGATVTSYEPDFYGRMDDGANTDQITDRLLVTWDLHDPWVERAMSGDGIGARRHAVATPGAELISVPKDITMLREKDPEAAQQERLTVRKQFQSLLTQGYRVAGMSESREYVLVPGDASESAA